MSDPITLAAAAPAAAPPTGPVQSHVILQRIGLVYVGILVPSFGLLALIAAALTFSDGDAGTGGGLLLLGLAMLYAVWPVLRRAQLPYLATLGPQGLRLEPRDRTLGFGKPEVQVPLADIAGFSEEVASRTNDDAIQLVLFLADGRKLRLGDRPAKFRTPEANGREPVTVAELAQALRPLLAELAQALRPLLAGRGLAPDALRRPNFYQSGAGKVLAWLCWACVAAGVVLLFVPDVPWTTALRLFAFSGIYLGMYSRNRKLGV